MKYDSLKNGGAANSTKKGKYPNGRPQFKRMTAEEREHYRIPAYSPMF